MGRLALVLAAWVMFGEVVDGDACRGDRAPPTRGGGLGGPPGRQDQRLHSARGGPAGAGDEGPRRGARRVRRRADRARPHPRRRRRARRAACAPVRVAGHSTRGSCAATCSGCSSRATRPRRPRSSWALVHGARNPEAWEQLRADPVRARAAVPHGDAAAHARGVGDPAGAHPRRRDAVGRRSHEPRASRPGRNDLPARDEPRPAALARSAALRPGPPRPGPARRRRRRVPGARCCRSGSGPRGCIGQYLALAEMEAVLPALARRGDVEVDGESAKTRASRSASAAGSAAVWCRWRA